MEMEYSSWKLFLDAADLGSLSKAAAAYMTSQPHISRQISALEQECGGRLFQRTGRGVVLTEMGQRIAPMVRAWLASTDQLAADIRSTSGTPVGTVRIGTLPSMAHPLVSTLYYTIKERYPLVRLIVREGQGAQLETWLEDGSVDLAILYRYSGSDSGDDISLIETATHLVGARGDPLLSGDKIPFAALHKLPLVLFCRPSVWRDRLDQIAAAQRVSLNVALEADSLRLQTQVIANGDGYGLLGSYAIIAAPERADLQWSRIVKPEIPRRVSLSMSKHGHPSLAIRTVMNVAQEIVKEGVVRQSML
jgi:LysR family nitrogen assimilation transcriptional regulator